jgi:hypothetical protein
MTSRYLMAIAATAILPFAVAAQPARPGPAAPADPAAATRSPQYQSAFDNYQQWQGPQESPAKTWRATNDALANAESGMTGMDGGMPAMNMNKPMHDSDMPHRQEGK